MWPVAGKLNGMTIYIGQFKQQQQALFHVILWLNAYHSCNGPQQQHMCWHRWFPEGIGNLGDWAELYLGQSYWYRWTASLRHQVGDQQPWHAGKQIMIFFFEKICRHLSSQYRLVITNPSICWRSNKKSAWQVLKFMSPQGNIMLYPSTLVYDDWNCITSNGRLMVLIATP